MNNISIVVIRVNKIETKLFSQYKEMFPNKEVWLIDSNVRSIFLIKDGYSPSVIEVFDLDKGTIQAHNGKSVINYTDDILSGSNNNSSGGQIFYDQTTIWDYLK